MEQAKRLIYVLMLAVALMMGLAVPAMTIVPAHEAQAAGENGVRDVITPTNLADTGVTMTLAAASGDGHKFVNNGDEIIVVKNDYTDTITMTVVTGGTAGGLAIDDVDVAVAAGATKIVGPFTTSIFNQRSGSDAGRVYLNWDGTVTGTVASSVTLAAYTVP